jgi:hypothetical protein
MNLFILTPIFTGNRPSVATMLVSAPIERSDATHCVLPQDRSLPSHLLFSPVSPSGARVTAVNLRETLQNALQTLWAQDFTPKLLSPKI